MFTKYGAVYIVESVTGDQLVSARCTGEALEQKRENRVNLTLRRVVSAELLAMCFIKVCRAASQG